MIFPDHARGDAGRLNGLKSAPCHIWKNLPFFLYLFSSLLKKLDFAIVEPVILIFRYSRFAATSMNSTIKFALVKNSSVFSSNCSC